MPPIDSSYLEDKAELRAGHLPEGDVRVLDCFAGYGRVWSRVAGISGRKISRLPIDVKPGVGFHLPGDNREFLRELDLTRFNCIDLDAYSVPAAQLEILRTRQYRGWVYATFGCMPLGGIPFKVFLRCGVPLAMLRAAPTMFTRCGWDWIEDYLGRLGVTRIFRRQTKPGGFRRGQMQETYAAFVMDGGQ